MERFITHACGHEQLHFLPGYTSQQERKATWLQTTRCRTCFVADKHLEQANAAAADGEAIAHLSLPALVGSDRQTAWATTIRAKRLATMSGAPDGALDRDACLSVSDAKWWINHRDLSDADLIQKAEAAFGEAA